VPLLVSWVLVSKSQYPYTLLLERVGVSLEPAEARPSDGLGLTKAHAPVALDSSEKMSSVVEEEHL
jgi:hypothetical protein